MKHLFKIPLFVMVCSLNAATEFVNIINTNSTLDEDQKLQRGSNLIEASLQDVIVTVSDDIKFKAENGKAFSELHFVAIGSNDITINAGENEIEFESESDSHPFIIRKTGSGIVTLNANEIVFKAK